MDRKLQVGWLSCSCSHETSFICFVSFLFRRESGSEDVTPVLDTFGDTSYCQQILPGDVLDEVVRSKQRPSRGLAQLKFGTIAQLRIRAHRRVQMIRARVSVGSGGNGVDSVTIPTKPTPPRHPGAAGNGGGNVGGGGNNGRGEIKWLRDLSMSRGGDGGRSRMKLAQSSKFHLSFSAKGCRVSSTDAK